jgi:hypothetical protein
LIIMAAANRAGLAQAGQTTWPAGFEWVAKDNSRVAMTAAPAIQFATAAYDARRKAVINARNHKDAGAQVGGEPRLCLKMSPGLAGAVATDAFWPMSEVRDDNPAVLQYHRLFALRTATIRASLRVKRLDRFVVEPRRKQRFPSANGRRGPGRVQSCHVAARRAGWRRWFAGLEITIIAAAFGNMERQRAGSDAVDTGGRVAHVNGKQGGAVVGRGAEHEMSRQQPR